VPPAGSRGRGGKAAVGWHEKPSGNKKAAREGGLETIPIG
jgi:hypothetical protein